MAYGPQSEGATAADARQTRGAFVDRLQPGDIAVSPNLLSQFPALSYVDVVDPRTGQVLHRGMRVADTSWISEGHPTTNSFEIYNGQDLGHAALVPSGSAGSTAASTAASTAGSYLPDASVPRGSQPPGLDPNLQNPLLEAMRSYQIAQALRQLPGGRNPVTAGLGNAVNILQNAQRMNPYLLSPSQGVYNAALTQPDVFGSGGAFDVTT